MIQPSPGYVLIKDAPSDKLGNFVISNPEEKESMIGKVIDVGNDILEYSGDKIYKKSAVCKKGNTVVYPKYHSSSFTWEGEQFKIVKFEDVCAIVEEKWKN